MGRAEQSPARLRSRHLLHLLGREGQGHCPCESWRHRSPVPAPAPQGGSSPCPGERSATPWNSERKVLLFETSHGADTDRKRPVKSCVTFCSVPRPSLPLSLLAFYEILMCPGAAARPFSPRRCRRAGKWGMERGMGQGTGNRRGNGTGNGEWEQGMEREMGNGLRAGKWGTGREMGQGTGNGLRAGCHGGWSRSVPVPGADRVGGPGRSRRGLPAGSGMPSSLPFSRQALLQLLTAISGHPECDRAGGRGDHPRSAANAPPPPGDPRGSGSGVNIS